MASTRNDDDTASKERTGEPDPTNTDHPTGEAQAAENEATESPA